MISSKKSIRKFAAGLMVATLAVGFSAFTVGNANQYTFVRVSGPEDSISPADYEYQGPGTCLKNNDINCSLDWIEASAPALEAHPTGAVQMSTLKKGTRQ